MPNLRQIAAYVILSRLAGHKLRALASYCCDDVRCLVDLAFSFEFRHPLFSSITIKPDQCKEEIYELCRLVDEIKPKVVLEIGTAKGGTLFLFSRLTGPEAMIISVDLPSWPLGGGYPMWKVSLFKFFARDGQTIHFVGADSHDSATLRKIENILGNVKVDFLFIDADHSYKGVKKDFETYSQIVRSGGIIAFHDIVEHPPETGCEVPRFWTEVKDSYRYSEIVKDWIQRWAGIGIIYM